MTDPSILMQLGQKAVEHRDTLEIVKGRVGITHSYFDCWIYGFLENKNYDIEETVAKLLRRDTMERNELAKYEITDFMRETMAKGIIQLVGDDKEGRVTFYIVTCRDFPTAKRREENRRNFDMWLSYGTRLRKENQRCRITMLVNHTDASMWSNSDMTFQADVALRIAKYYPGAVDRMYICKMNRTLSAVAKPIFSRLPKVVSDRIRFFTDHDIAKGKLLELFDRDVLPVALGGTNTLDGPTNWKKFSETIAGHFTQLKAAVESGKGVKEWELENLLKEQECRDSVSQNASPVDERYQQGPAVIHIAPLPTTQLNDDDPQTAIAKRRPTHVDNTSFPDNHHLLEAPSVVDSDDMTLRTCNTVDDDDMYSFPMVQVRSGDHPHNTTTNRRLEEWARGTIQRSLSTTHANDAMVLLDIHEVTLRSTIVEMEATVRLLIVERWMQAHALTVEGSTNYHYDHAALLGPETTTSLNIPAPLLSFCRTALWLICVIMAFYFLLATIFGALLGIAIMVAFFFGMFYEPFNFYPYGFALLVAGYQTALICARGYELVRTSYRGRVLHFLRPLGPALALKVQATIFSATSLTLFIVFCVYSSRYDPVTGILYTIGSGWVISSVFILLYHVLFLVGVRGDPLDSYHTLDAGRRRRKNPNISGFSLYLFFNVTEEYADTDASARKIAQSYALYMSAPLALALLSGVALMVKVNQVFLIGCLAATLASAFLVNFLTDGDSWDHGATLLRLAVSFCAVAWLHVTLSVGFFGTGGGRGGSLVTLLVTMVGWMLTALCAVKLGVSAARRQWAFRVGWAIFGAHVVTALVMLFNNDWRAGVLVLVLFAHSALAFFRYGASSRIGSLTCLVGFLGYLIALVIMGMQSDATAQYTQPLSRGVLSNFTFAANRTLPAYENVFPEYTACLNRFAPGLDVVAMAVLSAMTYASDSTVQQTDLAAFFPTFSAVSAADAMPDVAAAAAGTYMRVSVFEDNTAANMTVVALSNGGGDPFGMMSALTMWIEAMAVAPIGLIIPKEWTPRVVLQLSRVTTSISPLQWRTQLTAMTGAMEALLASNYTSDRGPNHRIFLIGHDIAGGVSAVVGARSGVRTITFGSPGTVYNGRRFGFMDDSAIDKFVIPIVADPSTLGLLGGASARVVKLDCDANTDSCRQAQFYVQSLQDACYTPNDF